MAQGELSLPEEQSLQPLAQALVALGRPLALALRGPLGAGKTALVRQLLRALGHAGVVRSPTYTLVECHLLDEAGGGSTGARFWHLDLYRLGSPEEVDWLGLDEFDPGRDWLAVEWPDKGAGHLPPFDLDLALDYAGGGRLLRWRSLARPGGAPLMLPQSLKTSG